MSKKIKIDKKNTTYAFIDSQNLNLGVKSQGWNLDFLRFRKFIKDKYQVSKAFLFIGFIPGNEDLYKRLTESGYILIFKPTVKDKGKKIKGNVDAELVLHTMLQFNNYSNAVIISGDGDFHCLIEYLESKNKLKKIIVPNKKYSSLLRKYSQFIVNIDLFRNRLKKRK